MKKIKICKNFLLIFIFIIGIFVLNVKTDAATPTDINGHWAEGYINNWVDIGFISSYPDGTFKPNRGITRAEFMVILNNAFGFTIQGGRTFTDVSTNDWFYKDVSLATGAAYITGYNDGSMKPNNYITREESAQMLARILYMGDQEEYCNYFTDSRSITWSRGAVGAALASNIIKGYEDGSFRPRKTLTRAEAVIMAKNAHALKQSGTNSYNSSTGTNYGYNYSSNSSSSSSSSSPYITSVADEKDYNAIDTKTFGPSSGTEYYKENLMIDFETSSTILIRNVKITGDLEITKRVKSTRIQFKNVTVTGTVYVKGGGKITFEDSDIKNLEVENMYDDMLIIASGDTTISETVTDTEVTLEELDIDSQGFRNIKVSEHAGSGDTVTLIGDFNRVYIYGARSETILESGTIDTLRIEEDAIRCTVEIKQYTTVKSLVAREECTIKGGGKINEATISADDVTLGIKPGTVSGSYTPKYTSGAEEGIGNEDSGTYTITVTVIDWVNNPLKNATVTVTYVDESGTTELSSKTDSSGKVKFAVPSSELYYYISASYNNKTSDGGINLKYGDSDTTIKIELRKTYAVTFEAVDSDDNPLVYIVVICNENSARTNNSGKVKFMLPAGTYSFEYGRMNSDVVYNGEDFKVVDSSITVKFTVPNED